MNRMIAIVICLGLLASGLVANGYSGKEEGLQNNSRGPEATNLPSLEKFVLDISPVLVKLEELSPEERSDQLADWALYGTLARASLSSDDLRKATFNLAPIRFPFLEEVLDFDYGPGRRAFLPDGSVWLFYSERDEHPQVTLARLADQVRMERGDLPASLRVFRYRTELPEGAIYVEREKDIPTQKLFSPEYGYVEGIVSTAEELGSWLSQIDDVTHVRKISDSSIELGGRRFEKARSLGVTLEDIAALYQAHAALASRDQEPGFSLDPQWDAEGLVKDLRILLEDPGKLISSARADARIARLEEQDESARRRVSSTALDVESVFQDTSAERFQLPEEARAAILGILNSIEGKSGLELEEGAILPFLKLKDDLGTAVSSAADSIEPDPNIHLLALLEHLESRHRAQCARYDGPLQGTRVGMNLFYTDLLAKLWASVDYYREAPIDHVYGFQSSPIDGPRLEPAYWAETWALPSTRLWFGPNPNSYKGAPNDPEGLNFSHIGARVYSAGSNPLNPGEETKPNEPSRRIFGWWDRHFSAVADHEEQYHVQNQIMKWSVIAGWLQSESRLADLGEIEVDRSLRFDRWYKANQEKLRFKHSLPMLPEDRWLGGTECIEILRSYGFPAAGSNSAVIEGGVSLGGLDNAANLESRYSSSIPLELRRAGLNYEKSVLGRLVNLKDSAFELPALSRGRALVEAVIPSKARLRMGGTELAFQKLRSEVSASSGLKEIALKADDLPVGVLRIDTAAKGNRLSFESASLLRERSLLDSFSERVAWDDMGSSMLGADDAFLPPTGHYVVELEQGQMGAVDLGGSGAGGGGPPRIIRMAGPAGKEPREGKIYLQTALLRPFETNDPVRMEVALLTRKEAVDYVNRHPWQRLSPLPDREMPGQLERVFVEQGPPESAVPIKVRTGDPSLKEVDGYFGDGGVLYLKRPQGADAKVQQLFNDLVVDAGIHGEDLGLAWRTQQKTLDLMISSAEGRGIKAASLLKEGRYEEALDELRTAGREGRLREAVESYQGQLSSYLAEGQASKKPSTRLIAALDSLRRQWPTEAVDELRAAVAEVREGPGGIFHGRQAFREAGSEAASDFVEARLGQVEGLSPELASRIQLKSVGNRLHTFVDMKALAPGRALSRSEQEKIALSIAESPLDQVYVEDTALLNKFDWDGTPGPSLSEISRSPDVAWVILDAPELGTFRPGFLLDGKRKLVRREIPQLSQRLSPEHLPPQPQRIYLLRSCDRNGDSVVSSDERAGCLGL